MTDETPRGSPGVRMRESVWRIERQEGITSGARHEGEAPPESQASGLWFISEHGERRFLEMDLSELPTEEQLLDMPLGEYIELEKRAKPVS